MFCDYCGIDVGGQKPVGIRRVQAIGAEPSVTAGTKKMTAPSKSIVALVDDDRSIVKSLSRMLRSVGYEVGAFGSARELLDSLETFKPQCLVLDVHMPEMGGLELHSRLRAQGNQIPIIFMTAQDSLQTRRVSEQSGNMGLLLKPFEIPSLLAALERAIGPSAANPAEQ